MNIKTLILFLSITLLFTLLSCDITRDNPKLGYSESQLLFEKRISEFRKKRRDQPNDLRKDEVQKEFDAWLKVFVKDSVKLDRFTLGVENIYSGTHKNGYYVLCELKGAHSIKYWQRVFFDTEEEMLSSSIYSNIKDVSDKEKVIVSGDINFIAKDEKKIGSNLDLPSLNISISTIKNCANKK